MVVTVREMLRWWGTRLLSTPRPTSLREWGSTSASTGARGGTASKRWRMSRRIRLMSTSDTATTGFPLMREGSVMTIFSAELTSEKSKPSMT